MPPTAIRSASLASLVLALGACTIERLNDPRTTAPDGVPDTVQAVCRAEAARMWNAPAGAIVTYAAEARDDGGYDVVLAYGDRSGTCAVDAQGRIARFAVG